jgi:hypothetical protein
MMPSNLLFLAKYVFPSEVVEFFELTNIKESEDTLHFYLEEHNIIPTDCPSQTGNLFFPSDIGSNKERGSIKMVGVFVITVSFVLSLITCLLVHLLP